MNDGFFKPEPSVHLFVPPNHANDPNAPCLFTRGYWQRRSKEIFACPCEGPLPRGSSAAERPTWPKLGEAERRLDQKFQQITLSTSLTMIELLVMAGCAHSADCAI